MRFMILRKADSDTEASVMPDEKLLTAMGLYMQDMSNAGVLLDGEGLHPSAKAARIKFSKGKPSVIDGPFAETKELIAGYAIIRVNSRDEPIEWVKRWPALDGRGEVELELRQIFEADEFGDEFTPELREREDRIRAESEARKKQ
jgi:hypothetical protein